LHGEDDTVVALGEDDVRMERAEELLLLLEYGGK
jgi:hypothetical protein